MTGQRSAGGNPVRAVSKGVGNEGRKKDGELAEASAESGAQSPAGHTLGIAGASIVAKILK